MSPEGAALPRRRPLSAEALETDAGCAATCAEATGEARPDRKDVTA
jgi:hypothetical protein